MKYNYVKDLMTAPAIYCESNSTIKEVISQMKDYNIGFLPITKNNILIGVVTDRDIIIRGIGTYKLNTHIEKVMTNGNIHFVNPDTKLEEAAKIMAKNKVRRLVVLNDGKVTGVLTTKNLLKEPKLIDYVVQTYLPQNTLKEYSMYLNSNPHDSIKASDYPL